MFTRRRTRQVVASTLTAAAIALILVPSADARQRSARNGGPQIKEQRQQAAHASERPRIHEARMTARVTDLPQIFEQRQRARSAGAPWIKESRQTPASRGGADIFEQGEQLQLQVVLRLIKNSRVRVWVMEAP